MDYKKLLRKYIKHVEDHEGSTFISEEQLDSDDFTEKEINELIALNDEYRQVV